MLSVSLGATLIQCVGGGGGGGDDDMIMMAMMMSQMMMTKLSVCCGLVAQYEVHHKCCQSHSVRPSPNVWLVVVMMVVMMMAMNI